MRMLRRPLLLQLLPPSSSGRRSRSVSLMAAFHMDGIDGTRYDDDSGPDSGRHWTMIVGLMCRMPVMACPAMLTVVPTSPTTMLMRPVCSASDADSSCPLPVLWMCAI